MTPTTPSGERILVVDDEPDIVALVAYHLAKAGYRVSTASSGTDALESVRRERPALIVLDLMLPGMSGYEVLDQLRANDATRDVAVLMLTARREEADRIQGLSLGADDYLTKPFSPQELVLRVGAILRRVSAGGATSGDRLQIGALQIDLGAHRVTVDGDAGRPDADRVQAAAHAGGAARTRAGARAPARDGVGSGARHPDAHRGHARAAAARQARRGGRHDRDGARLRLSPASTARPTGVTLARRLLAGSLIVVMALVGRDRADRGRPPA